MLPNLSRLKPISMLRVMSRRALHFPTVSRASMMARHMSSSVDAADTEQSRVLFESNLATRTYILNRADKLNALDGDMISLIRSKVEDWDAARLCEVIIGTGKGKAFCAGGDIHAVMEAAKSEATRAGAIAFFKNEPVFEMNYLLGNLSTPYVAVMDGFTMGGGVGLSVHAPFRIATENTIFAMPETKIGYVPDVGANYFLPRLDGEIGTYLALTATPLKGRAVFEHGIATHFIPASRIPDLKTRLASLEHATLNHVNDAIEELHYERSADEIPPPLVGETRMALDEAFSGRTVEDIVAALRVIAENNDDRGRWASTTLDQLNKVSPTSLKVALQAIRRGKKLSFGEVLQMEMNLATAFINGASQDFFTGVTAVLVDKEKGRPKWSSDTLEGIAEDKVVQDFFQYGSPLLANAPQLSFPNENSAPWTNYTLPSEEEIGRMVLGSHPTSGDKSLNLEELLGRFERMWRGKHGVKEKVLEVAQRRCRVIEDPDRQGCLEWIH